MTGLNLPHATWRKSSHSASENCVELAPALGRVAICDSKNPTGPTLAFDSSAWTAFLTHTKRS